MHLQPLLGFASLDPPLAFAPLLITPVPIGGRNCWLTSEPASDFDPCKQKETANDATQSPAIASAQAEAE